ncbi:uncharacterized protein K460DRAFT_407162 [Cucurbitaria berberidis CBS 394.84]|uniref:Isopenicillin N synthase-like Fe(2+) 2OG dioxygenase domain-containing protein n=1 Tax=Cucurbitaria berberidis CBS 394.84 TaxID=1168544 RepID=A0A9P4GBY2_9PLEO|nr:uncharacterized protein K460DRAFT_407162 [Cucurbitaria berberidis CBS 394.84]KAF1842775.1 hypothetical protein K460DRAFT_407162 [Cucurbitaria berberidis CBS 394.84]
MSWTRTANIGDGIPKHTFTSLTRSLIPGPTWPSEDVLPNVDDFKATVLDYYIEVFNLAKDILKVLALPLDLEESYLNEYATDAVAIMRLLHYPSQPPDSPEKFTRGIGAHKDFGCANKEWLDVAPTPDTFVVN